MTPRCGASANPNQDIPLRAAVLLLAAGLLAAAPGAFAQVVTRSIMTVAGASAIAVNPANNKVYVASGTKNIVTVIDGATYATSTVNIGAGAVAIDIDTSTNKVFVANHTDSTVTVIDGATNAATTITLNGTPTSIAVNSVTHKIYAPTDTFKGSYSYGAVELIDEASGSVTDLDKGIIGVGVAINPVTNRIYVANSIQTVLSITVFDGDDNSYAYVSDVTGEIAIDTAANKVFVAAGNSGLIYIDGVTGFYSAIGLGGYSSVAVNSVTHKAYAAGGPGGITVFDEATGNTVNLSTGTLGAVEVCDAKANRTFVSTFTTPGTLMTIDGATNTTSSVGVGTLVFAMAQNSATGMLFLVGADPAGTVTVVDGRAASTSTILAEQPASVTAAAGSSVAFNAVAGAALGTSPTYRWSFDGTPLSDGAGITGSASPTLFLSAAGAGSAGTYTCAVSGSLGSATSNPATLTISAGATPGRLINLSSRSFVGLIGNTQPSDIIAGFVVAGSGSKDVILRGIGPTLATFSVTDAVPKLSLSLYDAAAPANLITSDAAWQTPPTVPTGPWAGQVAPADASPADFAQVGAFPLPQGSADAAVKVTLPAGGYTSILGVPAGVTEGEALAEVYDADTSNAASQLSNLSARSFVDNAVPITAGFVIAGTVSQTILVRASGPALVPFGVSGVLPAMTLQLFDSTQSPVASNSGWMGNPSVVAAAAGVGAFPWSDPSSADSALLVTLPPGSYTAQVSALNGSGGTALVEVYGLH